jgi:hypothetical protein
MVWSPGWGESTDESYEEDNIGNTTEENYGDYDYNLGYDE